MTELYDRIAADARYRILKELVGQIDGQLSARYIQGVLDKHIIRRDLDWVKTQMRKLASLGAVELIEMDEVLVARITRDGRNHLEERNVIEGITRPSDFT